MDPNEEKVGQMCFSCDQIFLMDRRANPSDRLCFQLNPHAICFFPPHTENTSQLSSSQNTEIDFGLFGLSPASPGNVYESSSNRMVDYGERKANGDGSWRPHMASRSVLLGNVPQGISDADVCMWAEKYGEVRSIDSSSRTNGHVLITFFDIRHAMDASEGFSGNGDSPSPVVFYVAFVPTPESHHDGLCNGCLSATTSANRIPTGLTEHFSGRSEVYYTLPLPSKLIVEFYDSRDAQEALRGLNTGLHGDDIQASSCGDHFAREQSSSPMPIFPQQGNGVSTFPIPGSMEHGAVYPYHPYLAIPPQPSVDDHMWPKSWRGRSHSNDYSIEGAGSVSPPEILVGAGDLSSPCYTFGTPGAYILPAPSPHYPHHYPHQQQQPVNWIMGHRGGGKSGRMGRGGHSDARSPNGRSSRAEGNATRNGDGSTNQSHFAFNVEEAQQGDKDARTTIMVRNIPNKYNQEMLLRIIDNKFQGKYDFFYLPIDFKNRCNLGYAFVNFLRSEDAADFYNEFHEHKWSSFNSKKVCQVTYARVQVR